MDTKNKYNELGKNTMITFYSEVDDWSSTVTKIIEEYPELNNLDIHIDINSVSNISKKLTILILQESPAVLKRNNILEYVKSGGARNRYNVIYTCIKELIGLPNVEYIHPSNISWVKNKYFLPKKVKNISMITSNNYFLPGHKFRISIMNEVKEFIDIYGRGFNFIENKEDGLKDYYYSIAVENDDTDNYFSEKLLDCFLTCTIPIYWGSNFPYSIFNPGGIINIKELKDLKELKNLTTNFYYKNINAVVENYFIAEKENRYLNHTLKQLLINHYYANN